MASPVKIYDVDKPTISLSYWQIAALGIVPVVGIGVWYYFRSSRFKKDNRPVVGQNGVVDKKRVVKETKSQKAPLKEELNNLDKTPLQRAQSIKDSGNVFFKEGKYEDAIRCYSEAIELCPPSEGNTLSTFYQNRAACHDQLNNLEGVIKDCTAALELNPKYTKALTRRGKAFQSLGKLKQCLEDVTAVGILENFQNPKTLDMADSVLQQLGKIHASEALQNKEPVQPSIFFVKSYFTSFPNDPVISAGDFEVVEVNSTLPVDGESSASHLERAKQLLVRGRYDEVIPACTDAVKHGEGLEPEALLLRATMYLLRGQHDLALEDLNTIIDSEVQNTKITVNALIKRASLYLQAGDKEKTFKDFETAEKLDPSNPDLYLHRGQVWENIHLVLRKFSQTPGERFPLVNLLTENLEKSIEDFKKCVALDPNFAIGVMQGHYAQYRQAVLQENQSGIAKAVEKFKRDIRKFPKCTEGYILIAQVLMDQQQYDDADQYFENATKMDPSNANLRVHRGLLHLQWKGDIDKAMQLINEGIKVDDKCAFCYETLATIEVQRGNLKRAVGLFDKAIPLSKTEMELSHLFSLRDAAVAQQVVAGRLGLEHLIGT